MPATNATVVVVVVTRDTLLDKKNSQCACRLTCDVTKNEDARKHFI